MTSRPTPATGRSLLPDQRRPAEADPSASPIAVNPLVAAGGDVVPLSYRVMTLSLVRVLIWIALLVAGFIDGRIDRAADWLWPLGYLLVAGLASAAILLIRHRATAVGGLGLVLCLDGVALQLAQHRVGELMPVGLAIGIFLAAACLLASFRTGLKLVIWQTLLFGIEDQGIRSGLFHAPPGRQADRVVAELILLWALVLVVCVAASVSERELRRRRHDAETVQAFASALHQDDEPQLVVRRVIRFVAEDLDAGRALVCVRHDGRLRLLAEHGMNPEAATDPNLDVASTARSPLLDRAGYPGVPALLLSLDQSDDSWLSRLLPGARRLIVLPLGADERGGPLWLVFEHRGQRGGRVERRVLATAGQVSATTALALSRAVLFQQARLQAGTDALTRLPNRRTFDERFAALGRLTATRFAVVLVDVDRFKAVNDTYGHQVGDQTLQAVAAALAAASPSGSLVARYGGEEFVVLLPGADEDFGMRVGEQLRVAVASIRDPIAVTASFGVAASSMGHRSEALLAAADAALYRAKKAGRNAVMLAPGRDSDGSPSDRLRRGD
jgi:two-component system, cell cycle response regulator